jgi:hypothetical protein
MTDIDASNKTIKVSCGYDEVKMLNEKVFFKSIPAGQEVLSDDTFIVRINRLYDIDVNDIDLEFSPQREGDFSLNKTIDIKDLQIFGQNWLQTGAGMQQDLYRDDIINFMDFNIFAEQWLIN